MFDMRKSQYPQKGGWVQDPEPVAARKPGTRSPRPGVLKRIIDTPKEGGFLLRAHDARLSDAAQTEGCSNIGAPVMSVDARSTAPGAALATVGVALLLAGFIWMAIIGYYPNQLPIIVGLLAVGALLAWLGQKMHQSAKRENALAQIKHRDAGKA